MEEGVKKEANAEWAQVQRMLVIWESKVAELANTEPEVVAVEGDSQTNGHKEGKEIAVPGPSEGSESGEGMTNGGTAPRRVEAVQHMLMPVLKDAAKVVHTEPEEVDVGGHSQVNGNEGGEQPESKAEESKPIDGRASVVNTSLEEVNPKVEESAKGAEYGGDETSTDAARRVLTGSAKELRKSTSPSEVDLLQHAAQMGVIKAVNSSPWQSESSVQKLKLYRSQLQGVQVQEFELEASGASQEMDANRGSAEVEVSVEALGAEIQPAEDNRIDTQVESKAAVGRRVTLRSLVISVGALFVSILGVMGITALVSRLKAPYVQ